MYTIGFSATYVHMDYQGGWFIGHFVDVGEQAAAALLPAAVLRRTQVEGIIYLSGKEFDGCVSVFFSSTFWVDKTICLKTDSCAR